MRQLYLVSGAQQISFLSDILALRKSVWPAFIRVPDEKITQFYTLFPDFQFSLFEDKKLVAIFNTLPLFFNQALTALPDTGVSWAIETALTTKTKFNNLLCATSMTVSPDFRNQGISKLFLNHAKTIGKERGLSHIVAAVRPNLKCAYPLIPIEEYLTWRASDDSYFDPWLRVHDKLGANFLHICYQSAKIVAPIADWMKWTAQTFEGPGQYLIKEALTPLVVENGIGTYLEPNVWVSYTL